MTINPVLFARTLALKEPIVVAGVSNFNSAGDLHAPARWRMKAAALLDIAQRLGIPIEHASVIALAAALAHVAGIQVYDKTHEEFSKMHCFPFWSEYARNVQRGFN